MTLPFYSGEVFATPLEAWQARKADLNRRVDTVRESLRAALDALTQAKIRVASLEPDYEVGDGSFQGGTDGAWEVR